MVSDTITDEIRWKDVVTITDSEIIINGQDNKIIKILGNNHTFRAVIIDENENELDPQILISICKTTNGEIEYFPARVFYADINMFKGNYDTKRKGKLDSCTFKAYYEWFMFKRTVTLNSNDKLIIKVVDFKGKISKEKTKFALECNIIG